MPLPRHWPVAMAVLASVMYVGCGSPAAPASSPPPPTLLNQATVIDALDYWAGATGITYVLLPSDVLPRLLLRPGTDGLGTATARGLVDGTLPSTNQAQSALIVISPAFGSACSPASQSCREIFRHEVGHGIGYLGEPPGSLLMSAFPQTDVLSDRERRMMIALYSLPIGARLQADGTWSVAASGASGTLDDPEATQDILDYNVNTTAGASFRTPGVICRWQLPIPVYFQR